MTMPEPQKVAITTGASQGIGAGLVAAFRDAGVRPQPSLPSRRGFHAQTQLDPPGHARRRSHVPFKPGVKR